MKHTVDRILLVITLFLMTAGFFIFSSASLGLLARSGANFSSVAMNQFFFGLLGGGIALFIGSTIYYRIWRKYAFYLFGATLLLTLLVFTPLGLELEYTDARRWLSFGGFSLQPAEFLKVGFIIYLATWLSGMQKHVGETVRGTLPFAGFVGGIGAIMLLQPDTDSFAIMGMAATAMFITAGGKVRDVFIMGLIGLLVVAALAFSRPYVMDRIMTFVNPAADPLGSGYQIQQSLIAIGSGGASGRGFGQSIQKFEYLPEPISDSIFAVYSEEFGFLGATILIALYSVFAFRGFRIATHAPDPFGILLVVGFVTLITAQAFLNIAGMLGLAPLSGLPLPFISHGSTALISMLAAVGIVLNVSRYQKRSVK